MPPKRKVITRKVKDDHVSDHEVSEPEDLTDVKIEVKEEPIFANEQAAPDERTPERVGIDNTDDGGGGIISSEEEDSAALVLKENISLTTILSFTKSPPMIFMINNHLILSYGKLDHNIYNSRTATKRTALMVFSKFPLLSQHCPLAHTTTYLTGHLLTRNTSACRYLGAYVKSNFEFHEFLILFLLSNLGSLYNFSQKFPPRGRSQAPTLAPLANRPHCLSKRSHSLAR